MIENLKNIMARNTKKKTADEVVELTGAEYVSSIQPTSIDALKQRYIKDRASLLARIEQEQKQVNAFEAAIAACEEILNSHTTADKIEIDGR